MLIFEILFSSVAAEYSLRVAKVKRAEFDDDARYSVNSIFFDFDCYYL